MWFDILEVHSLKPTPFLSKDPIYIESSPNTFILSLFHSILQKLFDSRSHGDYFSKSAKSAFLIFDYTKIKNADFADFSKISFKRHWLPLDLFILCLRYSKYPWQLKLSWGGLTFLKPTPPPFLSESTKYIKSSPITFILSSFHSLLQ